MIKRLLLTGLLAFVIGMPATNAQDTENSSNNTEQVQERTKRYISKRTKDEKRFAVSLQMPFNTNKMGTGVGFSCYFTDVLRLSIDGNYYFYQWGRRFNTIDNSGLKGHDSWGRRFDVNTNLNFVFGRRNFHFYIITGFYFSMGYSKTASDSGGIISDYNSTVWDDDSGATGEYINHTYYYYREKLPWGVGLGFNAGCGIEYQIHKNFRMYLDQHWALGLQSAWMCKLGVSYCF